MRIFHGTPNSVRPPGQTRNQNVPFQPRNVALNEIPTNLGTYVSTYL